MAKDPEVDPDAATVMPVGRREDPLGEGGARVFVESGTERIDGKLVSVSGREVVVHGRASALAVDAEVTLSAAGGKPRAQAIVVWTRSQGSSVAIGLALPSDAAAQPWSHLVG